MSETSPAEYAAAATLRAALRRFGNESARVLNEHGLTTERYELLLAIKARSDNRQSGDHLTASRRSAARRQQHEPTRTPRRKRRTALIDAYPAETVECTTSC